VTDYGEALNLFKFYFKKNTFFNVLNVNSINKEMQDLNGKSILITGGDWVTWERVD